jgi:hypothetical protein
MEKALGQKISENQDVTAGVAFCSLWNRTLLLENMKVIVLVSETLFFNEDDFLADLETLLTKEFPEGGDAAECSSFSYFAEKFGYRRFCMAYETDDLMQLRISKLLYEMEFPETRQMVGPSPEMAFPPFLGVVLSF